LPTQPNLPAGPFDIAIVGLGPVGAAAAILLADAGLRVIAFERDTEVYPLPRAVGMDGEIVRGFQRIGRGEELAALLQPPRPGARAGFANSQRQWLFGQQWREFGVNGWQPIAMFDQPEVDAYLRETAAGYASADLRLGHEFLDFSEADDLVTLHICGCKPGDTYDVRAGYLLGCDGAASSIRRKLGSGWHDLGYDHEWLVIDVTVNDRHTLGIDTLQVCDPDRLATYVATKDPYRRWEFKLKPGETREEMLQPDRIQQLIDPWTPRDSYQIRRAAVYHFHAATADRWQAGRVFLAGDAAHQTPPFLGQGMNAGMRDVINLAWKLALVREGTADPELLTSYQLERSAHAADLVEWAVELGRLMEHLAEVEAAERAGTGAPEIPPTRRASGYGQGRESPPLRHGILLADQVSDTGSTGYLFSQPEVRKADSADDRVFLLDELLGDGFAVVARSDADLNFNAASRALVERLNMTVVTLTGLNETRGHFDRLFETSTATVVRPDRYVFGHTTATLDINELLARLAQKLCLR